MPRRHCRLRRVRILVWLSVLAWLAWSAPLAAQLLSTEQQKLDELIDEPSDSELASRSGGVFVVRSPYQNAPETLDLVDSLAARAVGEMGYAVASAEEEGVSWRLPPVAGVLLAKHLVNRDRQRTLELAVSGSAESGYEITIFGRRMLEPASVSPSPDASVLYRDLMNRVRRAQPLAASPTSPSTADRAYRMVSLSYIQADRALAVLKAIGYSTIEFFQSAGSLAEERVYQPVYSPGQRLPLIVKLADAPRTSLLEPAPADASSSANTDNLGGTFLRHGTAGEQQQRLLVVYDKSDPASADQVIDLLEQEIDKPAREIVIEALVLELDDDSAREIGVTFEGSKQHVDGGLTTGENGGVLPFFLTFDNPMRFASQFRLTLKALIESGEARVLSKPSVLVLDGRQARIQIGQQVPVVKSTATATTVTESVDYLTVGIVLNLRPRVNAEGTEVTMQVETIVSAVNQTATAETAGSGVLIAPTLDNRQVQTFVRVANSTPFIIGGLVAESEQERKSGVPWLSRLPVIGYLFGSRSQEAQRKEVIVVLTPHVVPLSDERSGLVVPKDSERFDSFDNQLFQNSYRIRPGDVFDLSFVTESDAIKILRQQVEAAVAADRSLEHLPAIAAIRRGRIPGEEVLVRRMLWELIRHKKFERFVNFERTILFEDDPTSPGDMSLAFLGNKLGLRTATENALVLQFAGVAGISGRPFRTPTAVSHLQAISPERYLAELRSGNAGDPDEIGSTLILQDQVAGRVQSLDLLKGVLVLKRMLELNRGMELSLDEFRAGRQVQFPSQDDLAVRFHVVDGGTARLYYEVFDYYAAFEREFEAGVREVRQLIEGKN